MRAMEFLWLTLSQLFIAAFILRFLLQLARADFYNPVSQLVVRITQPLLRPVRRLVPAWGPVDIATILIVLVLQVIAVIIWFLIRGVPFNAEVIALFSTVRLIDLILNIYLLALIVHAIMSWVVQGYHPIMALLGDLTAPVLNPIRRILPTTSGIDFSPMVAILLIYFIRLLLGDFFPVLRGLL